MEMNRLYCHAKVVALCTDLLLIEYFESITCGDVIDIPDVRM